MKSLNLTRLSVLFLFHLLLFFVSCNDQKDHPISENISLEQINVPVIQGETTTISKLTLVLDKEEVMNRLDIELLAEQEIMDLSVFTSSEGDTQELLPGEFVQEENKWMLGEGRNLPKGKTTLMISVSLPEVIDLKSTFRLQVPVIEISGDRVRPEGQQNFQPYRIGKALRNAGDDGVAAYRIPGLATSNSGTILAVYDVRHDDSSDLQGDIDVGLSRSTDGGNSWEDMQIIMDMGKWGGLPENQNGIGDPSILVDPKSGTIWVVALWLHGKPGTAAWRSSSPGLTPEKTGQLMIVKSEDDGITWSAPANITQPMKDPSWQLFFNGPGKGIAMKDGTLVFAAQYKDKHQIPHSTIIYSKDQGESWQVGKGARPKTTESQVVELKDGNLMLNMRDDRGGSRAIFTTADLGQTWQEHSTNRKALIEPVCMASLIRFNEEWLLFSNPEATDGRYNITIKASKDDGTSWPESYQVLLDEEKGWGYSCMTKIDEENLGILYESSQAHMTFQVVPLADIIGE
jgi:sialidase-1